MLFIEPSFLFVWLPLFVAAYHAGLRFGGMHTALATIVVSSLLFYSPYGLLFTAIFAGSMLVNLAAGLLLIRPTLTSPPLRMAILAGALIFNFALLGLFKYANAVWALFQVPDAPPLIAYGIPAGISFYTFQQAVFIADAYYRRPEVIGFLTGMTGSFRTLKGAIRYLAFVSFFPQLIIGPIVYLSEYSGQATRPRSRRRRGVDLDVGLTLLVIGLFKKIVIADELARYVDPVFDGLGRGEPLSLVAAWLAALGYYAQLYFDFSGYSDMAVGIARLFGIRLPINFDSPLRATGLVDFYKRWHMTLTRVIARFVFTPLSMAGTRFAMRRRMTGASLKLFSAWIPFLLNFLAIALWHGASATFLVFGLIHALWYILETEAKATALWRGYRDATSELLRRRVGQALTVVPLMLTFALFRSPSLEAYGTLLASLAGLPQGDVQRAPIQLSTYAVTAFAFATIWLMPNAYELMRRYRAGIRTFVNPSTTPVPLRLTWRPRLIWAFPIMLLSAAVALNLNRPAPFLYAGF
jgi:D-alanyl-lipoteichoic acid acyltransferase DltB (MBOAT superfamily)